MCVQLCNFLRDDVLQQKYGSIDTKTTIRRDIQQKGHVEYWSFAFISHSFEKRFSTNKISWDALFLPHVPNSDCYSKDRGYSNNKHSDPSFPLRSCIPKIESQDSKKSDSHLSNRHLRTSNKTPSRKRRALQEKVGKAIDLSPQNRIAASKPKKSQTQTVKKETGCRPKSRSKPQTKVIKDRDQSALEFHFPLPIESLALFDNDLLDFHDPLATQLFDLGCQCSSRIESSHVITSSDRFSVDKHVRHCSAAGGFLESGLQAGAERVEVELNDVGRGCYCVGGEEDVLLERRLSVHVYARGDDMRDGPYLCFHGERAVRFGEDDYRPFLQNRVHLDFDLVVRR